MANAIKNAENSLPDEKYMNFLYETVADSMIAAYNNMQEGSLYFSKDDSIIEFTDDEGEDRVENFFEPGADTTEILSDIYKLTFVPFDASQARTVIANFAVHPEKVGVSTSEEILPVVSADFIPYLEQQIQEKYETVMDLDIDAYIPDKYIRNEYQKLDIYKRIAMIESREEQDDMLEELLDRFGEPPKAVQNLLSIARLKAEAHQAFITEVTQKGDFIKLVMYEKTQADPKKIEQMVQKYQGKMKFVIDTRPYFLYTKPRKSAKDNKDVLELTREMIEDIAGIS